MGEQKIETCLNIGPDKVLTAKFIEPKYSQHCLLCENTREIPHQCVILIPGSVMNARKLLLLLRILKHL